MIHFSRLKFVFTFLVIAFLTSATTQAQISFNAQSTYKYFKGSEATGLASNWYVSGFDDSAWNLGNAPFRYGDGSGGTELSDMQNNYSTVFLRSEFTADNIDSLDKVNFVVDWDDGFVLWINGQEALSQQAPINITHDAFSSGLHESGSFTTFSIDVADLNLMEGSNTIAVFVCNYSLESSDLFFDMSISATKAIPVAPELIDSVGITFSHKSGFYESAFATTLTSPQADANIVYTLDGSNPQDSPTRIIGGSTEIVTINPAITVNRAATPAVLLRASIMKGGAVSKSETRTFIYLDRVKTQSYPGGNWPNYDVNGQIIDLDVDTDVSNSSQYSSQFTEAMLDVPTLSVVTDNANLFDPLIGIYVNADQHGKEWERECSVELLQPDGSEGFNVNAGIRIRGGWSRHDYFAKHSFRLFFRSEYGDSKLEFPLFGDEGVDQFDKIDLRTAQNYAWHRGDSKNTMVREVFSRDSQRDMGQPYTRSRYYHLYINGMYWGLFQTQERSEARFASDYFGGNKDDYDVIKAVTEDDGFGHYVGVTDGNLNMWQKVFAKTNAGFETSAKYFALEGKDENGKPVKHGEVLVDIDNLIDYMISIFYTGNFDAPTSSFGGNANVNNFYIIKDRTDKSTGFKFFNHDAEHSLFSEEVNPGIGLYEDRVNIQMQISGLETFHPQWLHKELSKNVEYRIRFADRAMKHLSNGGVFTEEKAIERFNKRAEEIEMAIIGESARWGNSWLTKDNAWIPELNKVRYDFFPRRTDIVWDQLLDAGLLPNVTTAKFEENGSRIEAAQLFIEETTAITIESSSGTIYYTLDGTDPRMVGGEISPNAKEIASGSEITFANSAVIKTRVKRNNSWSAISHLDIIREQGNYAYFKVTELHYHPSDSINGSDTIAGKNYEFIEFKNTGDKYAINLTGVEIDSAIEYKFPDNMLLAPGQFFVIAAKPNKFYDRYGLVPSGNFQKNFSNGGERVLITNSRGDIIRDFRYSDELPWPTAADGEGRSLSANSKSPWEDPANATYWRHSAKDHGSPFADDEYATSIEEIPGESIASKFNIYPNPTTDLISITHSADDYSEYTVKLFDVSGSLIYHNSYNDNSSISLNELGISIGIYILNIEYNNQLKTEKIVFTP